MPSRFFVFLLTVIACVSCFVLYEFFMPMWDQRAINHAEDMQTYGSPASKQKILENNQKIAVARSIAQDQIANLRRLKPELISAIQAGDDSAVSTILAQFPVRGMDYQAAMRQITGSNVDIEVWHSLDAAMASALSNQSSNMTRLIQDQGVPCDLSSIRGRAALTSAINTDNLKSLQWYLASTCFIASQTSVDALNADLAKAKKYSWIFFSHVNAFNNAFSLPSRYEKEVMQSLLGLDDKNPIFLALKDMTFATYIQKDVTYSFFEACVQAGRFDVIAHLIANKMLSDKAKDSRDFHDINPFDLRIAALSESIKFGRDELVNTKELYSAFTKASPLAINNFFNALSEAMHSQSQITEQQNTEKLIALTLQKMPRSAFEKKNIESNASGMNDAVIPAQSLLYAAVQRLNYPVVEILLKLGVNPNIMFMDPTLLAQSKKLKGNSSKKVVDILISHGAKEDYFESVKQIRGISSKSPCNIGLKRILPIGVTDIKMGSIEPEKKCIKFINACVENALGIDDCVVSVDACPEKGESASCCPQNIKTLYAKSRCAGMTWRESLMYVSIRLDKVKNK